MVVGMGLSSRDGKTIAETSRASMPCLHPSRGVFALYWVFARRFHTYSYTGD
jgi:hypothetical protein